MARRILITGGSRGIGKAIALAFAAEGDRVAVTGRDAEALAAVAGEAEALPGAVHTWVCDVADRQAVGATVAAAVDALGGLDVVVNNAGISRLTPIDGGPETDAVWHSVLATNLHGAFWVSRAAVPRLSDGGRLIMISSALGRVGAPGYAAYCASKHGLIGLVRCLALELAPRGITVNAVAPGGVETDLFEGELTEQAEQTGLPASSLRQAAQDKAPLGRFVTKAEVAALVRYLADPAADAITAQVFGIDAGLTPHA